jgi:tyrosine-protein kinase Etk/Wzc
MEVAKASTVGNVRVIDPAVVDVTAPVAPKKSRIVILATLVGGLVSVALVLIQRAMHRGIESPDEIEALGMPVFASIPFSEEQHRYDADVQSRRDRSKKRLYILADEDPTDSAVEMMRNLRTSLYFNLSEAKNKAVMVTGPSPGVGKSFVSVNLACVSAKAGQKVILIDGDLRRGYLHRYFAEHRGEGLSAYLAGRESIENIIHDSGIENLHVITRGKTPPNPSELLMHERFNQLISEHLKDYDLIIIDTPPTLAVTDAAIVGRHTGNTLVVTRFEETGKRELQHTLDKLRRDGIQVTGSILNGVQKRLSNYYGYGYYGYNYSYKYTSKD